MACLNHGEAVKLIALDLDGTLLNADSGVSEGNRRALQYARQRGIHVVASTGRPLSALPLALFREIGIKYAVATNGASVYNLDEERCLFEKVFPVETAVEILSKVEGLPVHVTAHVGGRGYCPKETRQYIPELLISDSMKEIYLNTREFIPGLVEWIRDEQKAVQKITMNFLEKDGVLLHREEMEAYLKGRGDVSAVCGGWFNLETTVKGVDKGISLLELAHKLGIGPGEIMAVGDSENDLSMLKVAGIAVAMGNGTESVKGIADYVTLTNVEDGVAAAIYHYVR